LVLNYIWIAFFVIGFIVALVKLIFFGDVSVFPEIMNGTFDNAKLGFELSLGLTGVMTLWLGIMKIGEKGGAINYLSRIISPLFNKLFPDIPKNIIGTPDIIIDRSRDPYDRKTSLFNCFSTPISSIPANNYQAINFLAN